MTQPVPAPRYESVVKAAANVAREMHHSHVGVEHLFLAIISDKDAVPTLFLAERVDLQRVQQDLRDLMQSPLYITPSQRLTRLSDALGSADATPPDDAELCRSFDQGATATDCSRSPEVAAPDGQRQKVHP